MKHKNLTVFALGLLILALGGQAGATLTTIGQAVYGGVSYNLIYDNDSPIGSIIWLDYTKGPDTWDKQGTWAASLNSLRPELFYMTFNPGVNITWDGIWRLPATQDGPNNFGFNGTTTTGYNITSSEMGHLYYSELGNKGYYDTSGNFQGGWGLNNKGPFVNLNPDVYYWSGTEPALYQETAWAFLFGYGLQGIHFRYSTFDALAVRSGHLVEGTPVPEPTTLLLLGLGLVSLAGMLRKL